MCRCFYCKLFLRLDSMTHDISLPLEKIWFFIPKYIHKKTIKRSADGKYVVEFRPFFGFIILLAEGERIPLRWWKRIYRIKAAK